MKRVHVLSLILIALVSIGWSSGWKQDGAFNSIVMDGSIYQSTMKINTTSTAKMTIAGVATIDPCPTLGAGAIFIGKGGMPCFCNAAGVDMSIYDGTTDCW